LATTNLTLPFDDGALAGSGETPAGADGPFARDTAAREHAVDPRFNVALEASAGTGKTRVLVDRYVNLLKAGVDPANVLAVTFTRKAAAEMRERILATLRAVAAEGGIPPPRWRELRDRLGDITISTIDAFCLSLLREFPLEADLDPGFTMADETEVPRLVDEALDRALRICRSLARDDENVALAFAQLGERRLRAGMAVLLNRRLVAPAALHAFLAAGPSNLDVADACRRASRAIADLLESMPGGAAALIESGPLFEPSFILLARDIRRLLDGTGLTPAAVQSAFTRVREHFLTQDGSPRRRLDYRKEDFTSEPDWKRHRELVLGYAARVDEVLERYRRDLNVIVSRGISRMFQIALAEYRRTLDAHAVLDFSDLLLHALDLLRQMDEFAQSRYRLESRYHHILVDELQDTSRAQWELVRLLVQSWGEGMGLAHSGPLPPSIFVVGDRKQSIYGFRDADVSVIEEASRYLGRLRPDAGVRRAISRSFRAVPQLLAFVNDVCADIDKVPLRGDAFRYDEQDRFPVDPGSAVVADSGRPVLGVVTAATPEECAERTAAEIARLLSADMVRDRDTGVRRRARPADVAILFRTRESHREFERALEARGIPAYVYKGLGFFDADEIKDALALLWYLAEPLSDLRAAAFLRSRFVRLSDDGLRRLAPRLADALRDAEFPAAGGSLDSHDARALQLAREATARWRRLVDRLPPAELFDLALAESAYGIELRGPRSLQGRENLKKMRAIVRRIQNRGYATLGRIATHLDRLSAGDESNAVIDALDAVSLMTIHASKGLEFPVVFLVNLARGTANRRAPVRVVPPDADGRAASVSVGDFQSESDEDGGAKEREETKRLLYVALTRARDHLYLGSVLKDGRLQPGRGSLAEVIPPTLAQVFSEADGSAAGDITWRAASGAGHRFRVCSPGATIDCITPGPVQQDRVDDFEPLHDASTVRRTIAAAVSAEEQSAMTEGAESDRVIGSLVHILVQRHGFSASLGHEEVRRALERAPGAAADALLDPVALSQAAERAASVYATICGRDDVRAICASGERLHEVPFTMRENGEVLRGTIDCIVRRSDGSKWVLEFKTGRPRLEHRLQLALYKRAAEHVFAGSRVEAMLVYPHEAIAL
jgi:ATP-dependent helicase/nuclease subunit A